MLRKLSSLHVAQPELTADSFFLRSSSVRLASALFLSREQLLILSYVMQMGLFYFLSFPGGTSGAALGGLLIDNGSTTERGFKKYVLCRFSLLILFGY